MVKYLLDTICNMDTTLLMKYLGDTPNLRIIDFFLDNPGDYSKKEILEGTGMSKPTLYKIFPYLETEKVIIPKRKYGNTTLYALNKKHIFVKQVMSMDSALSKIAMKKAEEIEIPKKKKVTA